MQTHEKERSARWVMALLPFKSDFPESMHLFLSQGRWMILWQSVG
jgi:hypothetical protein